MPNFIVLPIENDCNQHFFLNRVMCLPRVTDCFPQNDLGLINDCDDVWNKNLVCPADRPFGVKYAKGDKIHLQFRYHFFEKNPSTFDLSLELFDCDDNLITDVLADFLSEWVSGVDPSNDNYQNLVIDTSLPVFDDLPCFYIKAKDTNDLEYCSELFQLQKDCKETLVIESLPSNDCLNGYYGRTATSWGGTSDFAYSNALRYNATLKQTGNTITEGVRTMFYTLNIDEALPPYMHNILTLVHLGYEVVIIDGVEYFIDGVPRIEPRPNSSMFFVRIDLFRRCQGKGCK
jgi:hypothetical protein